MPAAAGGPLDLHGIAADGGGVDVALDGEGVHDLAALLLDWRERNRGGAGPDAVLERRAGFFGEFTDGRGEGRFVVAEFALGD